MKALSLLVLLVASTSLQQSEGIRVNTVIKVKTHGDDLPPEMGGGVKDASESAESEKDNAPPPAAASAKAEATPAPAAAPDAEDKKAPGATPTAPDASLEKSDAASAEVKVVVPKAVPAELKSKDAEKDEKKVTEDPEEPADKPEEAAMKKDEKPAADADAEGGEDGKDKKKVAPAVNEMGLMHDGTDIMKTPTFLLDAAGMDEGGDNLSRTLDAMQEGPCEDRLNMTEYQMKKEIDTYSRKLDKINFDNALTIYQNLTKSTGQNYTFEVHTFELYDKAFTFPRVRRFDSVIENLDMLEHFQDNLNVNPSNSVAQANFFKTAKTVRKNFVDKYGGKDGGFNDPANFDPYEEKEETWATVKLDPYNIY